MLFTAIDVALATGTPTATLFHTAYTIFRGGPLVEMLSPGLAIANARRAQLGLPGFGNSPTSTTLAPARSSYCPASSSPDVEEAPNVLRVGPVLDAPPLSQEIDDVEIPVGPTPLVLVSLRPANRARPTCCSAASTRSPSCPSTRS